MANTGIIQPSPPKAAPIISISHQNTWMEQRHGIAFLGPIVTGILKRSAVNFALPKR